MILQGPIRWLARGPHRNRSILLYFVWILSKSHFGVHHLHSTANNLLVITPTIGRTIQTIEAIEARSVYKRLSSHANLTLLFHSLLFNSSPSGTFSSLSLSLFLACTTSHRRRYYKHFRTNYAPLDMQDTKRRLLNVHWKLVFVLASCSMPESFLFNLEVLRTHCVRTLCISTTRSSSNNAHCIFAEYCRHCSDRKTAKSTTLFAPMIFYRRFFLKSS